MGQLLYGSFNGDFDKGPIKGQLDWPVPNFLRNRIKAAVNEAERLKGSPPNTNEVYVVLENTYILRYPMGYLNAFMQGMFRENELYADKHV